MKKENPGWQAGAQEKTTTAGYPNFTPPAILSHTESRHYQRVPSPVRAWHQRYGGPRR